MAKKKKAPVSAAKKKPTGKAAKKTTAAAAQQKLPTYKGNAGLPAVIPKSTAMALSPPMSQAALDARQSNIGIRRKPGGPPKPQVSVAMANAIDRAPDVPPTRAAEPPRRDKR